MRQPSVAQWEAEKTEPTRVTLRRVANVLGVSVRFLEFGEEGAAVPKEAARTLPVYRVVAPPGVDNEGMFGLALGDVVDHTKRPGVLANVKEAYALYLPGNTMWPWRAQGQIVYVNPARPPAIEDHVLVQLNGDGEGAPLSFVKRLVQATASGITLRQYHPDKESTLARVRLLTLHRVMDWDELMQG